MQCLSIIYVKIELRFAVYECDAGRSFSLLVLFCKSCIWHNFVNAVQLTLSDLLITLPIHGLVTTQLDSPDRFRGYDVDVVVIRTGRQFIELILLEFVHLHLVSNLPELVQLGGLSFESLVCYFSHLQETVLELVLYNRRWHRQILCLSRSY